MANDIFDWSTVAASNTAVDGVDINTGMSPAGVDNAFRALMRIVRNSFATALQSFLAGTAALPIANGGTGATSAGAALTGLGALASTYQDIVPITKAAAFTFANSERGGGILYTGVAAAATIDPNGSTAINTGATYAIRNGGSGVLTVTRGTGVTLYVNGGTTSANASLAIGAIATLIKWDTNVWTVSGSGVS